MCTSIVSMIHKHPIITVLIIGTVIRLCLMPFFTYSFDSNTWAMIIANGEAGANLYDAYGYFYSPTWGYLLFTWGQLTSFIPGISDMGTVLPQISFIESYGSYRPIVTSPAFNVSFKILLMLFDIAASYVVGYVVEHITKNRSTGIKAFALCYLCPAIISISVVSGFFDILAAMFAIMCLIFLVDKKYFLVGVTFSLSVFIKFFPIFIVFIIIAYILKTSEGWREKVNNCAKTAIGCTTISILLLFPQITNGQLGDSLSFLTDRAGNITSNLTKPSAIIVIIIGIISLVIALLIYSRIRPKFISLIDAISEKMNAPRMITLIIPAVVLALIIMACVGFQRSLDLILNNPVPTYCVIVVISLLWSIHVYHSEKIPDLGQLVAISTIIIALTMLYVPNPQYLAVLIPFMIVMLSISGDKYLKICLIALTILVFIYPFDNLPFLIASESAYMGLDVDWLSGFIRGYMEGGILGFSYRDITVSIIIFSVQICVFISILVMLRYYLYLYDRTDDVKNNEP